MYLNRSIEANVLQYLRPNKVLLILGPRRVGKTHLLRKVLAQLPQEKVLQLNGEDMATGEILKLRTVENYKRLLSNYTLLVIDEAQKIPEIGLILKLMVDEISGLKILVTGSSMFDLNNKLGEPLTGRKITLQLFSFAQQEYMQIENLVQTKSNLEERLIFGSYPELLHCISTKEKTNYLNELVSDYLLKDILTLDGLRNSSKMLDLLKLIAFQIGKEVSLEELGKQLGLSKNTVERYLDLLSKVFVVYKLSGFSRNLRSEVVKSARWYFYDNGIRNALIANFSTLSMRTDVGELWKNYCFSERLKHQHYQQIQASNYFWRTYQQQEIDWIEDRDGNLFGYELKWNSKKAVKPPKTWSNAYPNAQFAVITPDNYLDWIGA
ncbi:MAG: ATP-binding protein [Bacteroidetes bacterium]|nr:ATP-binding protein [Bacteroidota bacterium]